MVFTSHDTLEIKKKNRNRNHRETNKRSGF